jgi:hypothetical protein
LTDLKRHISPFSPSFRWSLQETNWRGRLNGAIHKPWSRPQPEVAKVTAIGESGPYPEDNGSPQETQQDEEFHPPDNVADVDDAPANNLEEYDDSINDFDESDQYDVEPKSSSHYDNSSGEFNNDFGPESEPSENLDFPDYDPPPHEDDYDPDNIAFDFGPSPDIDNDHPDQDTTSFQHMEEDIPDDFQYDDEFPSDDELVEDQDEQFPEFGGLEPELEHAEFARPLASPFDEDHGLDRPQISDPWRNNTGNLLRPEVREPPAPHRGMSGRTGPIFEKDNERVSIGQRPGLGPPKQGNKRPKQKSTKTLSRGNSTAIPPAPPVTVPFDETCKGNCPLKHNLLPKYEPDDGGQLRCPEHDGRKFRSKQGALFEIACYADFNGRNMKMETETSLDACINTCTTVQQCKAVVFIPGELDGACYLKFNAGKSHMNPFVMSAKVAATSCQKNGGGDVDCERHNKVWEMEQEEARRERHRHQLEETRTKIEELRRQRDELEKERQRQRMQHMQEQKAREARNRAKEADRLRWEEYMRNEEEYRIKQQHEIEQKQRDQERESRRYKWLVAQQERERERLRHQVEAEQEALETEIDRMKHGQWEADEAWWRSSRYDIHPGTYEINEDDINKSSGGIEDLFVEASLNRVPEFTPEGDYPTDDEWRWYSDPSWRGYWDAEEEHPEVYQGWVTEEENNEINPWDADDWFELSRYPYVKRDVDQSSERPREAIPPYPHSRNRTNTTLSFNCSEPTLPNEPHKDPLLNEVWSDSHGDKGNKTAPLDSKPPSFNVKTPLSERSTTLYDPNIHSPVRGRPLPDWPYWTPVPYEMEWLGWSDEDHPESSYDHAESSYNPSTWSLSSSKPISS